MHQLIFIIMFFLFVPVSHAQTRSSPAPEKAEEKSEDKSFLGVFRGFVWGLPPTIILEHEQGTFMGEEEGRLFYLDYIRGIKSTIGYEFLDNKLWRARIFIEKIYTNVQHRLDDLMTIRADLTKRYGAPVKEEFKWVKDTDKNFPESWGWAIYRSELFITIIWQDAETEVVAYLGAEKQYDPQMVITYTDRQVKETQAKNARKTLLKAP